MPGYLAHPVSTVFPGAITAIPGVPVEVALKWPEWPEWPEWPKWPKWPEWPEWPECPAHPATPAGNFFDLSTALQAPPSLATIIVVVVLFAPIFAWCIAEVKARRISNRAAERVEAAVREMRGLVVELRELRKSGDG
jgi:hypothetical protein